MSVRRLQEDFGSALAARPIRFQHTKTETARRGGWRLSVHFVVVCFLFSFVRVRRSSRSPCRLSFVVVVLIGSLLLVLYSFCCGGRLYMVCVCCAGVSVCVCRGHGVGLGSTDASAPPLHTHRATHTMLFYSKRDRPRQQQAPLPPQSSSLLLLVASHLLSPLSPPCWLAADRHYHGLLSLHAVGRGTRPSASPSRMPSPKPRPNPSHSTSSPRPPQYDPSQLLGLAWLRPRPWRCPWRGRWS